MVEKKQQTVMAIIRKHLLLSMVIFVLLTAFFSLPQWNDTLIMAIHKPWQPSNTATIEFLNVSIFTNLSEYFYYVKIPRLGELTNKARIGEGNCFPERKSNNSKLEMIFVTNYIPVDILRHNHSIYESRPATHEEEEARIAEITSTFQANLNHPHLKTLYIFVEFYESMVFLHKLNFNNSENLVIQWINKTITVIDTLRYISKCFQGHIVAMIHQDNRIGKGFEKVNPNVLINNKLMYALTRHSAYEICYHSWKGAPCPKVFVGSHDAFIFHVKEFAENDLEILNVTKAENNESGMENILIWMFRKKLGYRVINPCLLLNVHHEHCVPIRKTTRRRLNNEQSGFATFTDRLI